MQSFDLTAKLEKYLNCLEYPHPKGDYNIHLQNERKFTEALCPFLISKAHLAAVIGGYHYCSEWCKGERSVKRDYKFKDECRFLLSCGHYSPHIQCFLSPIVYYGVGNNYGLCCPINDTQKCRVAKREGNYGELKYWGQKEYHAFFTAFLRNRALVEAFIDKQKLAQFNSDSETFLQN